MTRKKKPLRTGYTTGTCAAAAAQGAALKLLGRDEAELEVSLPGGEKARIAVHRAGQSGGSAFCEVVKDAGDDPDVTNGALIRAVVRKIPFGIVIKGGEGVGMVTRPGLAVAPGKPAINPVPERMIRSHVAEIMGSSGGAEVTICVADGAELARKTLNPRLGIVGGISILGTTGLVIPYSHEAYQETITCALDVLRAMGVDRVVFSTGRSSEKEAQRIFSELPAAAFVLMADYFSCAVHEAVRHGLRHIIIAGYPGKLLKMAAGAGCTHYRNSAIDLAFLSELALKAGLPEDRASALRAAHTARHALDFIPDEFRQPLFSMMAHCITRHIKNIAHETVAAEVLLLSYEGGVLFHEKND